MKKLLINNTVIPYKVVKKPIKHLYLEVKEGFVEVRCNHFVPHFKIEKFIIKHSSHIIQKLKNEEFYYLFGKKYDKNCIDVKEIYIKSLPPVIFDYLKIYTNKMNLYPTKVSFRFNKSRWGSCSAKNALSFNYYLAKLPKELIEYVVVHELAHIRHKNHSRAFWEEVEKFLKDYKLRIRKLKKMEKII